MRRYTTPTIEITIGGADLTGCDVLLTLRQGGKRLTVRADESGDWTVGEDSASGSVTLTQEQTASFDEDEDVEVQGSRRPCRSRWASVTAWSSRPTATSAPHTAPP